MPIPKGQRRDYVTSKLSDIRSMLGDSSDDNNIYHIDRLIRYAETNFMNRERVTVIRNYMDRRIVRSSDYIIDELDYMCRRIS